MNNYQYILEKVFLLERLSWEELAEVPEFKCLINSEENIRWHREKYTHRHISAMMDLFFDRKDGLQLTHKECVVIYLAILWHDAFKPHCLSRDEKGIVHNYGHEQMASRFIWDFITKAGQSVTQESFSIFLLVSKLTFWHMFKGEKEWASNRAKYCVSMFKPDEIKLLAILHIIDVLGAINDINTFIPNVKADLRLEVPDYQPHRARPILSIMVGGSGSGKSTFVENTATDEDFVVSTDQIREEIYGDASCQQNHELIFGTAKSKVRLNLEAGKNVFFDATNLSFKHRKNVVDIAKRLQVPIYQYVFLTPLNECLANQSKRSRQVPEDVVINQYKKLELPCYSEASKVMYVYQGKIFKG